MECSQWLLFSLAQPWRTRFADSLRRAEICHAPGAAAANERPQHTDWGTLRTDALREHSRQPLSSFH